MKLLNKTGFTLAEILITIGIIGVVAALTIPVLMQNSNSKKFTTQFKKSLSTLNQAAIGAQAQYDMDYSTLTTISEDASCKSDTLSGGKYTLCGLFNNTLSAQTYLGKYGNVKGANLETPYAVTTKTLNPANYLFFSFADGALVAFDANAKGCGVGVGQVITTDMLTSGKLANCLGFVDVNGPNPPNSEVSCADGDTVISVNTTCKVTNGSMGDIFPVVFHDGSVEPATNASLAAFLGGNGKEEQAEQPKYDLSTPEGRKRADVDNMENIANAFKKAFLDNELPMANHIDSVQFTVYGKDNGGDTKLTINTKYPGGSEYKAIESGLPEIIKNSGVDLNNIMVNSSDDKWKYGYTINYDRKTNALSIWARGKNDNSSNGVYWYKQTDITEADRQ